MAFKVVNVYSMPIVSFKEGEALVAAQGGVCASAFCRTEDEIVAAAADADAIVGMFTAGHQSVSDRTMDRMPRLRHIASVSMGYEGIDAEGATARGICVSNAPDYAAEEMANHALLFVLALGKKLVPTVDAVRAGKWDAAVQHTIRARVLPPLFRLSRQTLGLVGFGNIPRMLAPRASSFGMRVIVFDPFLPETVMRNAGVEPVDFDTLLRESDFISLHATLNPKTRHMMGMEQFKKMKPTAFFINTARGGLVDETALQTALTSGIIAGAAVDVLEIEPPKPDNPLLKIPNLIVTPHTGQNSREAEADGARMPYEEIVRVMKGGWPRDVAFRNPQVKEKFLARWSAR